jgi:two-component system, OmpR family, sensor histidine kinase KdpD
VRLLSQELAVATGAREVVEAVSRRAGEIIVLETRGAELVLIEGSATPNARELEAAKKAFAREERVESFVPLIGGKKLGVFGSRAGKDVELYAALTAIAFERARLSEEARLLTAVSHDLRTPLASIRGSAEVLLAERALDREVQHELLDGIRVEADRLARLVANLLDLSRLESGALAVSKAQVPLEDLIGSALERMRARLFGRSVDVDVPAEIVMVPADPVLLGQALIHLLDNAEKYSPPQSPIAVRAARREKEIDIAVLDRGPGLPAGEEQRVFEKFYCRSAARGTGLGLTICEAIVRAHGGTIRAENRAEGGARFMITLALGIS